MGTAAADHSSEIARILRWRPRRWYRGLVVGIDLSGELRIRRRPERCTKWRLSWPAQFANRLHHQRRWGWRWVWRRWRWGQDYRSAAGSNGVLVEGSRRSDRSWKGSGGARTQSHAATDRCIQALR